MTEHFAKDTRAVVRRAAELAEAEGASMVEIEHLFTALVDPPAGAVGRALVAAGITAAAVRDARDREFRAALALVGVTTGRSAPAGARRLRRGRSTTFAPSARLALDRTLETASASGDRRIAPRHLLTAISDTSVGVMPRLLRELDIDPDRLRELIAHCDDAP